MAGVITGEADLGTGKLLPKGTVDAFVARFTPGGVPVWVTPVPSTIDANALAVLRDPGGGVFAALQVTGDLDLGAGIPVSTGADSLVFARLDADGGVEWARNVGGIVLGTGVGLVPEPSGHVLAYGGYAGAINLGALPPAEGDSDGFVAKLLP